MKQKLIFFTILMIVLAMPKVAVAYDFSAVAPSGQTLYYNIVDGDAQVTYPGYVGNNYHEYTRPTGSLTIPSSVTYGGNTYTVTSIKSEAFHGCTGLTTVTIPSTINTIEHFAFSLCTGLTTVNFNATNCTSAGSGAINRAFYLCSNISTVNIGNNVTRIPNYLFYDCGSITSVTIPDSVTTIGRCAFYSCTGLTNVTIGNFVTSIGISAFEKCYSLTSVTIGNSVTTIGSGAFKYCGLTSVSIPNSVTSIGRATFNYCTGLTSVTIPNSVTSIGKSAFSGCRSLTSATISNSVTSIRDSVFYGCSGLTNVTIPNSVTTIGDMAFKNCENMRNVTIGRRVTTIGSEAFVGCTGLVSITCRSITPPALENNNAVQGLSGFIVLKVPCGAAGTYATTAPWSRFDIREVVDIVAIPDDASRGTVSIVTEPTCTNREAQVRATAFYGYHFDHWSDGNRDNPRHIVVQQDTTIIAYFYSGNGEDEGIEETVEESVKLYQHNGQIVVEGAEGKRVMVYDMYGRVLATRRDEGGLLRFDAPATGVYLVRIGDAPVHKVVVVR